MADPEIWRALLETGNPYVQQERRNKGLAEMLAIEKAQRGLRQEEQLQQLFARSQKPSVSEVGAVMPSYVPEYVKSQYEGQRQQQELDQTNYEQNASIFGPISERALIAKQSGDPQWQEKFNRDMGIAASGIVQSGGRLPNNFNPQQADPWTVLTNSVGFKYKSPYMENMMAVQRTQAEQESKFPYEARLKGMPSYGDIKPTWDSQRGQWISTPQTQAPSFSGASAEELNMIEKSLPGMPEGPDKEGLKRFLAEKKGIPQAQTPTGLIPLADVKAQEAGATKTAQLTAEEEVADRKAVDSYFRGRPPEEVRDLIKSSIEGDVETGLARIGKALGVSVPGGAPTAALQVITQQLASSLPFSPGSQSDAEFRARLMKIGDPASNEPIENRLAALDEFYRDQEAFITQKWKPESMESILDMRKQGFISEDNARKVFKRFKQSKSGAM